MYYYPNWNTETVLLLLNHHGQDDVAYIGAGSSMPVQLEGKHHLVSDGYCTLSKCSYATVGRRIGVSFKGRGIFQDSMGRSIFCLMVDDSHYKGKMGITLLKDHRPDVHF